MLKSVLSRIAFRAGIQIGDALDLYGPGTPEGIAGVAGSTYRQSDGTLWIKESDVTDEGWTRIKTIDAGRYVSEIMVYAGGVAPNADWLPCDGTTLDEGLFPKLYAIIGTSYDPDGLVFKLPDLRLRAPLGAGQTTYTDLGDSSASFEPGQTADPDPTGEYGRAGLLFQSHAHEAGTLWMDGAGPHSHIFSVTSSTDGAHDHGAGTLGTGQPPETDDQGFASGGTNGNIENHTHPVSGRTGSEGAHSHSFAGSTGLGGDHAHNINGETAYSEYLPNIPYQVVNYFIKVR